MEKGLQRELERIVGSPYIMTDPESLLLYGHDATPEVDHPPCAVLLPATTEEVIRIVRVCKGAGVSITPRGSGTNLSGGAVSTDGGVVLQTSRMNRILEIDEENLTVTVEPGVITADLHREVESRGLFYPPDPGSMKTSTLGGNVAENSGGLRGLKYGVTADYVMGLSTVLGDGELLVTGGKAVKDVAGYALTPLLVSSEGTLGIFTSITLRLLPLPRTRLTMLAHFRRLEDGAEAVSSIIAARIIPATLEIMDRVTIDCVEGYARIGLPRESDAILLIEVDGHPAVTAEEAEGIETICQRHRCSLFQRAADADEAARLTAARRSALSALARSRPTTILEDATVPRSALAPMIREIQAIAARHRVTIGTFGHAGDGNLHPTCLTDERDREEIGRVHAAFEEIFHAAVSLGGTITGEHGVGIAKKRYLPLSAGERGVGIMGGIKRVFDPAGIFNPGKIV